MVSSALNMDLQDLLDLLARFRTVYADSADYRELRGVFPADWPL
jgi:hypothetical protein